MPDAASSVAATSVAATVAADGEPTGKPSGKPSDAVEIKPNGKSSPVRARPQSAEIGG